MILRSSAAELRARIPGPVTRASPAGERFAVAFAHGSMSVEYYAPVAVDPQTPHAQDELYFIHGGNGDFYAGGASHGFKPGDCFFVPAGVEHRFTRFTPDFGAWVVFWGPPGGEAAALSAAPGPPA